MNERVSALEQAFARIDATLPMLTTKAEVAELRGDLRAGFADIRADLHRSLAETHKWALATAVALLVAFGGIVFALANLLRPLAQLPQQSSAPQPPTIVVVPQGAAPLPQPAPAPSPPKR
jgi:hypothetical protein